MCYGYVSPNRGLMFFFLMNVTLLAMSLELWTHWLQYFSNSCTYVDHMWTHTKL